MGIIYRQNIKHIDVNAIEEDIDIIDIREKYEFVTGTIDGSVNVPMQTLLENPQDYMHKDKTYYILCQHAVRSEIACYVLNNDYDVISLDGGYHLYNEKID